MVAPATVSLSSISIEYSAAGLVQTLLFGGWRRPLLLAATAAAKMAATNTSAADVGDYFFIGRMSEERVRAFKSLSSCRIRFLSRLL